MFACETENQCPGDWYCVEGRCQSSAPSQTDDGGVHGDMDASADADQVDGDGSAELDATADAAEDASSESDAATIEPCPPLGSRPRRDEPLSIASATWSCDVDHVLTGTTIVNGTLTLTPGTRVLGSGLDALVVLKGGQLQAVGSAQQPIVFTSEGNPNGVRAAGGWAGIKVLGSAPVGGQPVDQTIPNVPAADGSYGGQDTSHDCGTLAYVRVEFAGAAMAGLNTPGLLLAGCGTSTDLHHLQVHRAASAGLEVAGGTLAIKQVVVSSTGAEGLRWRNGWTGAAQFLIVHTPSSSAVIGGHDQLAPNTPPISAPELLESHARRLDE